MFLFYTFAIMWMFIPSSEFSFIITWWRNVLLSTSQRSDISASSILYKTEEWVSEAYVGYESSLSTPLQRLGSSLSTPLQSLCSSLSTPLQSLWSCLSTLLQRLLLLSEQWILSLLYFLRFSIPPSLCYRVSIISSGNLFRLFLVVKLANCFIRS